MLRCKITMMQGEARIVKQLHLCYVYVDHSETLEWIDIELTSFAHPNAKAVFQARLQR